MKQNKFVEIKLLLMPSSPVDLNFGSFKVKQWALELFSTKSSQIIFKNTCIKVISTKKIAWNTLGVKLFTKYSVEPVRIRCEKYDREQVQSYAFRIIHIWLG